VIRLTAVKVLSVLVVASLVGAGCGHCDGAIRGMDVWRGLEPEENPGDDIEADAYFRINGDGPNEDSEALLRLSGVDGESWQLLDADGASIDAEIGWWAGGHMCRNGVAFELRPSAPLEPGSYTLVLWLDDVVWPVVGEAKALRTTRDNRSVLLRTYEVVVP
jgi:hypothetical protein